MSVCGSAGFSPLVKNLLCAKNIVENPNLQIE